MGQATCTVYIILKGINLYLDLTWNLLVNFKLRSQVPEWNECPKRYLCTQRDLTPYKA